MTAGTIERVGRTQAAKDDDPLCFHLWGYDPAEYFNYLALPGKLTDNLASPSALACGIDAAIAKIKGSAGIR